MKGRRINPGPSARRFMVMAFSSLCRVGGHLIENIGGFGAVGARFGVPDIGLNGLGDISQAVRDIRAACDLPVLVDADDGYGHVKNVVHTVHTYVEEHEAKIRAAAASRRSCARRNTSASASKSRPAASTC